MGSPSVFFVRHKFRPDICEVLRRESMIAYNYVDEFHDDINDYSEGSRGLTQAFNAFNAIAEYGALVVAEYSNTNEFLVTKVDKGQSVERKNIGSGVYKVLRFHSPKTYKYSNYPLLAAIRPPYATACEAGRSFSQLIKHIYLGEKIELATDFMHPSTIELMCETYLRSELAPENIRLKYTLLRTGKTMPAVDIYGKTFGNDKLFAQVTYGSENPEKTKALVDFAGDTGTTILFSKDKSVSMPGLDHHVNIDDVFNAFMKSKNPDWHTMIEEMIGL